MTVSESHWINARYRTIRTTRDVELLSQDIAAFLQLVCRHRIKVRCLAPQVVLPSLFDTNHLLEDFEFDVFFQQFALGVVQIFPFLTYQSLVHSDANKAFVSFCQASLNFNLTTRCGTFEFALDVQVDYTDNLICKVGAVREKV